MKASLRGRFFYALTQWSTVCYKRCMEHTTYEIISRKDARAQGLKYYFTGKSCKHGHTDQRFVSNGHCVTCSLNHRKAWGDKHPERERALRKRWQDKMSSTAEGREYLKAKFDRAYATYKGSDKQKEAQRRNRAAIEADPSRKAMQRIRSLIKNQIAANGGRKAAKTEELLGCTVAEARAHLEAQFLPGMTWDNHGEWHIDHIRPCASFDFSDPQQQKECSHYTNLQPLWAKDNLSKSDKWEAAA